MDQRSRLPIQHPEYRYASSRNPYAGKIQKYSGLIFSDNETESHAGRWRSQFQASPSTDQNPLHVEIGCNGGHVVLEWAARHPGARYVGLDWKFKQIFFGAEKAASRELQNLIFFRAHADRLQFMFGKGEVDHLYLFFPDPWPKKAQRKNRWFNEANLVGAAQAVRPGGSFWIKTDHPGYFEEMEKVLALPSVQALWHVEERSADLHASHPAPTELQIPDVTLFEKIFIREGIRIHSLKLTCRG